MHKFEEAKAIVNCNVFVFVTLVILRKSMLLWYLIGPFLALIVTSVIL